MSSFSRRAIVVLLAAALLAVVAGCAGTRVKDGVSSDPELIKKEIAEIESDIINQEELYKANLSQMQMEESGALRREVNEIWMDLEHLRSRKAALEERLAELEAAQEE